MQQLQIIIFFYFFVCSLILLYTIGYEFLQSYRVKKEAKEVEEMKNMILNQKQWIDLHGYIQYAHLAKKLRKVNKLLVFDKTLRELKQDEVVLDDYLSQLEPMVNTLVTNYRHKNQMEQAYLAWFIANHSNDRWIDPSIYETLLSYKIAGQNIYLRENVLVAIYQQQNIELIIKAFHILTNNNINHHSKLIQDGLLKYPGDKELLAEKLWEQYDTFHQSIDEGIIGFITRTSDNFQARFYERLKKKRLI